MQKLQRFSCCVAGEKQIHPKPFQAIAKLFYELIPHTMVDFRYHSWVKPLYNSISVFIYITFSEVDFGLLFHCEYDFWEH